MPISERLLRKWRKEALPPFSKDFYEGTQFSGVALQYHIARDRILKMTQELLDDYLLKK